MGGAPSKRCTTSIQNPDVLSVVTLSDSAVQRLPLIINDSPLDKEQREQNIDDFWRDRLQCLEDTFAEAKYMTDKEFYRLEFAIKKMAPGAGKVACPRMVEDTETCYLINTKEPMMCSQIVQKLLLCMDTLQYETTKKMFMDEARRSRKRAC